MNKILFLKGCAGLGNRFITLCKAIEYAKKTSRKLYVDWADGMFAAEGENAFYKYFEIKEVDFIDDFHIIETNIKNGATLYPKSISVKELHESIYKNYRHVGTYLSWKVPLYRILVTMIMKGKITSVFGLQSWQHKEDKKECWIRGIRNIYAERNIQLGSQLQKKIDRDIVVFIDFRPLINISHIFDYIKLKPKYANIFHKFAEENNLKNNAIGVHIRATDKRPRKQIDKLTALLDKKLLVEQNLNIFLSTDSIQILQEFQKRYRTKIIVYPKFLPEELKGKGIHHWALNNKNKDIKSKMFEDSLADMWLLSMCKYLYWQGNSSFSLISKILKNDKSTTINWMR